MGQECPARMGLNALLLLFVDVDEVLDVFADATAESPVRLN